jgi:chloramphenicol-sensitive protein RarD
VTADGAGRPAGVAYGLAAFLWWGGVVFYFKAVAHVPALEVLAHRIVWSTLLLFVWLAVRGRLHEAARSLRRPRLAGLLAVTAVLIALNWGVFIWAVAHDRVLQASLGYFINPLVNVLLGFLFLGERFRRPQLVSILLAACGVTILAVRTGQVPVISLVLAFSFGLYGLLRKRLALDGVTGLAAETALLTPPALVFLLHENAAERLAFGRVDPLTDGLLVAAGVVTAVPLVWFVNAAQRLRYATVGFLQYLMPTMAFVIAVSVFREPFSRVQLLSYGCIWVALILYSVDVARGDRGRTAA